MCRQCGSLTAEKCISVLMWHTDAVLCSETSTLPVLAAMLPLNFNDMTWLRWDPT